MEKTSFVLLDGAMGTMLQGAGLPAGALPEVWNITHPEAVTKIQRRYVEAGSDLIYANTFGANRLKLAGCGYSVSQVVAAGIEAARKAAEGTDTKVALDIGPLGHLLAPLGTLEFEEAYDIFREMLVAGEQAGADVVIFETMGDLREVKAGILAAREHTNLPIMATMTFEKSGRTFVGVTVPAMAVTLDSLGVSAMGFNCSLGPEDLLPMVEELTKWTDKPIILKPNAGLPDSATGAYTITPEEFAESVLPACKLGVKIFGGCCGTGPDYIEALKEALKGEKTTHRAFEGGLWVCGGAQVVDVSKISEVGATLSPDNEEVAEAVEDEDYDTLADLALDDADEDADVIRVYLPEENEADTLPRAVAQIQTLVSAPLMLKANCLEALEAGIQAYNGRPLVDAELDGAVELCRRYGAVPVKLDQSGNVQLELK